MSRRIMLIPVGTSVGLTTVSMGLVRAIEEQGIKLNFYKPVAQPRRGDNGEERSTAIISHHAEPNVACYQPCLHPGPSIQSS